MLSEFEAKLLDKWLKGNNFDEAHHCADRIIWDMCHDKGIALMFKRLCHYNIFFESRYCVNWGVSAIRIIIKKADPAGEWKGEAPTINEALWVAIVKMLREGDK